MAIKIFTGFGWGVDEQTLPSGNGLGSGPQVSNASGVDAAVTVNFNQTMDLSAGSPTVNPDNYQITADVNNRRIWIYAVQVISSTQVRLLVGEHFPYALANYTLRVVRVRNEFGQTISGGEQSIAFTGQNSSLSDITKVHAFFGLDHGMQSDVASGTSPDITVPQVVNQDPAPLESNVNPTSNILLEVIDPGSGVDEGTVEILVNGTTYYKTSTGQNGASYTRTPIGDGYQYELDLPSNLPENTVATVRVKANDLAPLPNELDTSYTFNVGVIDFDPPVLRNLNPAAGGSGAATTQPIFIEVNDEKSGVSASSVLIIINGVTAWQTDSEQNGFTVDKNSVPPFGFGSGSGGFTYLITPPAPFLPSTQVVVQVQASDLAAPPNHLNTQYTFDTVTDVLAPEVVDRDPDSSEEDVQVTRGVCFSLIDDFYVVEDSIQIWINDVLAWDGNAGGAQEGFGTSIKQANTRNGFDFCIIPQPEYRWQPNEVVEVRVRCQDTVPNTTDVTWTFTGTLAEYNPFSMYRMLLRAIQQMDERSPGTLQKMLQGFEGENNGMDQIWEDLILSPQQKLSTLFDPSSVDSKWLPWLKTIVGFTRDLNFTPSELELRRVIENAVLYWNAKPSTGAIERALRMTTGNRYRLRDYFKLRMQADQTSVTEELADFDPNVLDFGQAIPVGSAGLFGYNNEVDHFWINDLPGDLALYGFTSPDQFLFLQVLEGPNIGTYVIRELSQGSYLGKIDTTLGPAFPVPSDWYTPRAWRLVGEAAEYTQELRVVDEGQGEIDLNQISTMPSPGDILIGGESGAKALVHTVTAGSLGASNTATVAIRNLLGRFLSQENVYVNTGPTVAARTASKVRDVLNTDLLTFLLEQIRPVGERIDVVLIDFIDQFFNTGDLEQWMLTHLSGGTSDAKVDEGTGYVEVSGDSGIVSGTAIGDFQDDWRDQTTAWLVQAGTSGAVIRGYFFVQNVTLEDCYLWELDYTAQELRLFKSVGGTETQLGSTVFLPFLFSDQEDTVRVDLMLSGANTIIRVRVDGELFIEVTDNQWADGRIAFAALAGIGRLLLAEVNTIPTRVLRVGPR